NLATATLFINETETLVSQYPAVFAKLMKAGKIRRMSYDCYPHALVAAGHIDAVVDCNLQPYDFLPIVALIEAAGGLMTDWEGNPLTMHSDGRVLSAATPELLAELIELVGGAT
ncbi:MAG: inositol monophosphatase family protein, partial [Paracoccaceae bacterium]